MYWPGFFTIRRFATPIFDLVWDFSVREVHPREFAGVWHVPLDEAIERLHEAPDVYANNLASLKYLERDGARHWEKASFALRPDGLLDLWQVHFRLFYHPEGTALYVHYERSPLRAPSKHVNGVGYDASRGIDDAHQFLNSIDAEFTP